VQVIGNAIVLKNVPANTKIEVYNMQGKPVKTYGLRSGVYIVKIGKETFRVAVK
jgi:hypothetical protein